METERFSTFLERSLCLLVSPLLSSQTGIVESDAFDRSLLGTGSSSLGPEVIVCRFTGSSGGRTSQASLAMVSSDSASCYKVSLGSRDAAASCGEVIKCLVK